jgi:glycosyltransferase involved in cell wall biosynthesis
MLGSYKGLHVLLDAYAQLFDPPPLVLIGPRASDTPTDLPAGVTLSSDWPHVAVLHAWRRSLLGLVPSVWPEPCPTVALEAMSAGRAVIASEVGGLPDLVIDGETGLLVTPGDPSALRDAIQRLLRNRDLLERMGQAGRLRAREFQASSVVGRIEAVYQQVEARAC